jgi:FtsP/CotA-like multicopper oxidase with cupredoxin domain
VNAAPPAAAPATARPTGGTAPVVPKSPVDLELTLRAEPSRLSLLDGPATEVWHFSAHLEHGMSDAVVPSDSSYLGPTLRVKRGQRVRVHFENSLDEATIVHWHGLDVDAKDDGHPSYAVPPGGQYSYDFEVRNRAGTSLVTA